MCLFYSLKHNICKVNKKIRNCKLDFAKNVVDIILMNDFINFNVV